MFMRKLGIWQVSGTPLRRVAEANLELERNLEDWIVADPSLLREGLVITGRQVPLECGPLDLLAIDPQGRWVLIELKRGTLDRKTVAQVVDYAACMAELPGDELRRKLEPGLRARKLDLDELLEERGVPDALDPAQREMVLFIVGTGRAAGLERVVRFLGDRYGMPISVVLFDVFRTVDGQLLLTREVAAEEESTAIAQPRTGASVETALRLAEEYGTQEQLARALKVVRRKGLKVRPWPACLMITPPSNGTRMLFTLWAKPKNGLLKTYIGIEPFTEFFPVDRAEVEGKLGAEGWRYMSPAEFDQFLAGLEALELGLGATGDPAGEADE